MLAVVPRWLTHGISKLAIALQLLALGDRLQTPSVRRSLPNSYREAIAQRLLPLSRLASSYSFQGAFSSDCYNLGQSLALPHDPTRLRSPQSAAVVADADGASVGGQV